MAVECELCGGDEHVFMDEHGCWICAYCQSTHDEWWNTEEGGEA